MQTIGLNTKQDIKLKCYLAIVRSVAEYGSAVWSPHQENLLLALEAIQRRATNYIVNNPKRPSPLHISLYKERLLLCKLLPLSYHREITDIILLIKLWNGNGHNQISKYVKLLDVSSGYSTRARILDLDLDTGKPNYFLLYPYRVAKIWNKLPEKLRRQLLQLPESDKIKRLLLPHYHKMLVKVFDPDSTCTWVTMCECLNCRT